MGKIPCAGQTIPSSVVGDAAVPQVQVISLAVVEAVVVALARDSGGVGGEKESGQGSGRFRVESLTATRMAVSIEAILKPIATSGLSVTMVSP